MIRMTDSGELYEDALQGHDTQAWAAHIDGLAWSQAPPPDVVTHHSWRPVLIRGAGIIAAAAAVALGFSVLWLAPPRSHDETVPSSETPTTSQVESIPSATLIIPPDIAPMDSPDAVFQTVFKQKVDNWQISDPAKASGFGRELCSYMSGVDASSLRVGETPVTKAADMVYSHPGWTVDRHDSYGMALAAARAYCPQYATGEE
jgi:hypothetical protein